MKKRRYSSPYISKDYFSKDILPSSVHAARKTIRQQLPYRHHDEIDFLLIRNGEGVVTVNGRSYPVRRGSLLCFSPNHFHKLEIRNGDRLEISECHVNSGVYFFISASPYYQATTTEPPTPPVFAQLDEHRTKQASELIDKLALCCEKLPISENQPAFFLLMKLFGLLEKFAEQSE